MKKIEFYFDFLSPYSYLAWTWVRSSPYEFEFYPVSMGSIIAAYDTKGPAQIEPKRNYLFKDLLRSTKMNNIPFTTPKHKTILKVHNLYTDELLEKMENKDARIELKANVERALQLELFGVPSFVVNGETFWGYDSTKYLEMYLNGTDPLDKEVYEQFITKFIPR